MSHHRLAATLCWWISEVLLQNYVIQLLLDRLQVDKWQQTCDFHLFITLKLHVIANLTDSVLLPFIEWWQIRFTSLKQVFEMQWGHKFIAHACSNCSYSFPQCDCSITLNHWWIWLLKFNFGELWWICEVDSCRPTCTDPEAIKKIRKSLKSNKVLLAV